MSTETDERKPQVDINTVIFGGRLATEPTVRGKTVEFVLATHRIEKVDDKPEEVTDYRNVTVFGDTATACRLHLKKGRKVTVTGREVLDEYEAKDGDKNVLFRDEEETEAVVRHKARVLTSEVHFG